MTEDLEDQRHWRLPRGRHGLPRELVTRSQRERLLAAVVRVTAQKGYDSTTVGDILGEAGVGRESFYELFDDRLDCMLAAHRILVDNLEQRVRSAYCVPGPWPRRVSDALASTLDWFAADPDAARFTLIELSVIGPQFRGRFREEFERFTRLLDEGMADAPAPALPNATSLAVGGSLATIYEEVLAGRAAELPRLHPDLTYQLLVPFLGEAAAGEERLAAVSRSARR